VNKYKEAMAQWGAWQILGKLHETSSKDEAKACFIALQEKGEWRWDDIEMWKTLNRLTASYTGERAKLYIKPAAGPQLDPDDPTRSLGGSDLAARAINALWGEGQYNDWYTSNGSKYGNEINNYVNKGRQLEADPKGTGELGGEMVRLLKEWKAGKYVNPEEYEGLIDFAISNGKMSMEQKLFFIIEGVTSVAPSGPAAGLTLLDLNRIGVIDGKYLNQMPLLDYFTNKDPKPFHPRYLSGEISLEETKRGYTKDDYISIMEAYYKGDSEACKPGKNFSKFFSS
jgi:hypothetical protein